MVGQDVFEKRCVCGAKDAIRPLPWRIDGRAYVSPHRTTLRFLSRKQGPGEHMVFLKEPGSPIKAVWRQETRVGCVQPSVLPGKTFSRNLIICPIYGLIAGIIFPTFPLLDKASLRIRPSEPATHIYSLLKRAADIYRIYRLNPTLKARSVICGELGSLDDDGLTSR